MKNFVVMLLGLLYLALGQPAAAADHTELNGDILQVLTPLLAYGTTFYLEDTEGRKQFHLSFISTVIVTQGLKYTIHEQRPNGVDNKSFPSGHTSAAFQGAAFIHYRYGWEYSIPAYVSAVYVGYSRVRTKNHFIGDVFAGAAIGMISNMHFVEPYNRLMVAPVVEKDYVGVSVNKVWN